MYGWYVCRLARLCLILNVARSMAQQTSLSILNVGFVTSNCSCMMVHPGEHENIPCRHLDPHGLSHGIIVETEC